MANELGIFSVDKLNMATIKGYLKGGGQASDEELILLINLCKQNNMNPFMKEVYFIKYGNQAAQIVVSRDFYRKRAFQNPNFDGVEVGVIVLNKEGILEHNEGTFKTKDQELVGAWARVHLKNTEIPIYVAVSYDEYVQMKDGHPNKMWTDKPCTMLGKVAESQALRMAFPAEFSGTYGEEEFPEPERSPREVNGVTEPTREQIESFNKEEYANKKIEQLKAKANEHNQENESQDDTKQGKIINDVTMEDF
ncbi:phage recombination protein Bet [Lactococcus hircilactis]|uniref:Phage recombination protein Bet n=1 Tax=Lactococcus hircilactis TaxID=1494462 RepID=A0A7X1Z9L0_9LACT|nr:phage recombination protein Bet [Lactococcus hircilactis]MQW40278.1 phage recombination protein Bet [Lactococcus hircilactis]